MAANPLCHACIVFLLAGMLLWAGTLPARGTSSMAPWSSESSFQELVFGGSSSMDVQRIVGRAPDNVVKREQIYPVIENDYYFDAAKTGAASVFVFENNLLVGLLYKSANDQYVDLTYFLPNNGDRMYNSAIGAGIQGYYPSLPLYTW